MIKFKAQTPDGPLYGFGLSRATIDRLTAGQPIPLDLAERGRPAMRMVLMFGESERALSEQLHGRGVLNKDTDHGAEREVGTAGAPSHLRAFAAGAIVGWLALPQFAPVLAGALMRRGGFDDPERRRDAVRAAVLDPAGESSPVADELLRIRIRPDDVDWSLVSEVVDALERLHAAREHPP